VPVLVKNSHFVFWAARLPGESAFRASDLEMFVILARQATVALENARLHAELRAYIRQVEESQRALVQAEKMAMVGRLTASIAHEINNPLQAVQNCLHLAGRSELPEADRQKYQELAQSELERLMHTVQRMLDFYRPGAVDRKATDINEIVNRMLVLVETQLDERKIHIRKKLAGRMPPVLIVKDQIQQVLLNLVLNAAEAMPAGGELFINTLATRKAIEVTIEDTGPGIPAIEREHIFEPFVSTKEDGTGLGLAVSYGIVAAHGGSLELVQGKGPGACFRVTLPIGDA
jgi:two-component system NtrC family sensor kinase